MTYERLGKISYPDHSILVSKIDKKGPCINQSPEHGKSSGLLIAPLLTVNSFAKSYIKVIKLT